jgi:hypothetical protein
LGRRPVVTPYLVGVIRWLAISGAVLVVAVACHHSSATIPASTPGAGGGKTGRSSCVAPQLRLLAADRHGRLKASALPPPFGLGREVVIYGLSALSRSDVWAVGTSRPLVGTYALGFRSIIAHWDGHTWSQVAHPRPPQASLIGVAAISASDVWAVGAKAGYINNPLKVSVAKTLVEHWDGHRWRVVPSPNRDGSGQLNSLATLASNDIWAAGGAHSGGENAPDKPLVEHWNGSHWLIARLPFTASTGYTRTLAATTPKSVWVDAYDRPGLAIAHWDGHTWRVTNHVTIDSTLHPMRSIYNLRAGLATPSSTRWHLMPRGTITTTHAGIGVNWPVTAQRQIRLARRCGA